MQSIFSYFFIRLWVKTGHFLTAFVRFINFTRIFFLFVFKKLHFAKKRTLLKFNHLDLSKSDIDWWDDTQTPKFWRSSPKRIPNASRLVMTFISKSEAMDLHHSSILKSGWNKLVPWSKRINLFFFSSFLSLCYWSDRQKSKNQTSSQNKNTVLLTSKQILPVDMDRC